MDTVTGLCRKTVDVAGRKGASGRRALRAVVVRGGVRRTFDNEPEEPRRGSCVRLGWIQADARGCLRSNCRRTTGGAVMGGSETPPGSA